MKIIPAVDLLDGKVVRLLRGDYAKSTVYGEKPTDPIGDFISAGAELIHIVDLNAARNGDRGVNSRAIEEIAEFASGRARLELGGGIRDLSAVEHYFALGIERCILGTAAVRDPDFLREALGEHGGEKIIVGVDARDGRVKVSGWEQDGGIEVEGFLKELERTGVAEVIFTDIQTDGALTGPALDSLQKVLQSTVTMRIIASGGIASIDDVRALLELRHPRLVGAISGRAIYEKRLDLAAAVRASREFQ